MQKVILRGASLFGAFVLLAGQAGCGQSVDSADTFDGTYSIQDAQGVTYTFEDEGMCYYRQKGTYQFSQDTNMDGEEANLLSIQFETQSGPSVYTLEESGEDYTLTTTYTGASAETVIPFSLVDGMDGLETMQNFDGTFCAYDQDAYRYEFHMDGTVYLVLEQEYAVEENQISFTSMGKEFVYDWSENQGTITLSDGGETIAVLNSDN